MLYNKLCTTSRRLWKKDVFSYFSRSCKACTVEGIFLKLLFMNFSIPTYKLLPYNVHFIMSMKQVNDCCTIWLAQWFTFWPLTNAAQGLAPGGSIWGGYVLFFKTKDNQLNILQVLLTDQKCILFCFLKIQLVLFVTEFMG